MMTENKQHLVPEIQFKGFTNAWEQRKLSDLVDFSNGINAPKEQYGKGRKMISVMDILSEEPIQYSNIKSAVEVDEKTEQNCKVESGDLVFVRSSEVVSEVGWVKAYTDNEYALFSGFTIRGKKKAEFDNYFVELSLNSKNRKQIESKAGGSTRFNVSQVILSSIVILQPSYKEQTTISLFFRTLDDTINLHKRKLDGLRELKKGYMHQMFPQAGERKPRVRFAGFSGEWQEQKLGELFKERNERSSDGELISVTINSGVIKASELERKDNSSEDKSNYKKVEVGDIAYNSMRMWQGASGISNFAGIVSPAYTVIIPDEGVDSLFFSYMFKLTRMLEIFKSFSQGLTSDTWNLKFPLLKEIYVTVPCSNEQAAISDFFRIIDEQITAQAIKLEQLGQLKAAYLQRMFI